MLSPICHGCGNPLTGWDKTRLPLCVRCREEINALPTLQRVQAICEIQKALDQNFQTVAAQRAAAALQDLADHVCEHPSEEIEEDT